jgi:hypothetical protein
MEEVHSIKKDVRTLCCTSVQAQTSDFFLIESNVLSLSELSTVNFHLQHQANSSKQGAKKSKKLKSNSKWKETEGDDAMSYDGEETVQRHQ